MLHLKDTAKKLNKRNKIPMNLPDPSGIIGTVNMGYEFLGTEVTGVAVNPALGKWYVDRDNSYYWGGGLIIEPPAIAVSVPEDPAILLKGLPANIPSNFRLGIDVSHHNENINWGNFKEIGVSFAYIKLSEGVNARDKKANENALAAQAQNIKFGYYHFCHPDTRNGGTVLKDATAEANEVLDTMKGLPQPSLPLVLDLEDWNGADTKLSATDYLLWVETFLNVVNTACMIYSRKEYLDRKLPKTHQLGKRTKLWLSIYRNDGSNIKCPIGWDDWAIWQYTEKAATDKNPKFDANIMKDLTLL